MINQPNKHKAVAAFAVALVALSGCNTLTDLGNVMGDESRQQPALPGERIAVLSYQNELRVDALLEDSEINLIQPLSNGDFISETSLQQAGLENIKISGFEQSAGSHAGDGNGWQTRLIAQPVIGANTLFAIDARGVLSAHNAENIDDILWQKALTHDDELQKVEGGGLTYANGVVYATTGYGSIIALVASDGSLLWRQESGTPIRSAPAVADNKLYTITIDNQLLALSARTGQSLWSHRGIHESTIYLGEIAPVIENGIVVAPYSSGEIYALRAEDGSPLWSDNLIASKRTSASSALTGIDASPIVRGNIMFALGNSGLTTAAALSNGQGLWDMELSSHHTPWLAGDYLFIITADRKFIALHSREKRIKWMIDLTELVDDARDMPMLAAPIMLNNQLAITTNAGEMWMFDPNSGNRPQVIDIPDNVLTAPITSNGNLYLIDQNARLYQYR